MLENASRTPLRTATPLSFSLPSRVEKTLDAGGLKAFFEKTTSYASWAKNVASAAPCYTLPSGTPSKNATREKKTLQHGFKHQGQRKLEKEQK